MLNAEDLVDLPLNTEVKAMLLDLFMAVTDAYDGSEGLPSGVSKCYNRHWKKPAVQDFYGKLVDLNHL